MHFFTYACCILIAYFHFIGTQGKSLTNDNEIEGYYWRPYNGKVPADALLGGTESSGNPTYIGQGLYNGVVIPGQLSHENETLYFEWGDAERSTKENINILCTQFREQFEWIRTSVDSYDRLQNDTFVYGGIESGFTIYIGRAQVEDELVVGKVLVVGNKCKGLNTSSKGKFYRLEEFEILNYNPDIPHRDAIVEGLSSRMLAEPNSGSKTGLWTSCWFILTISLLLR